MKSLFFTSLAEADLEEVMTYIAQQRPQTARQVLARIREKCEQIAAHPELGERRTDFPGDYRSFTIQRWVIFYRVKIETVEIHRVLDGARDIHSLLG